MLRTIFSTFCIFIGVTLAIRAIAGTEGAVIGTVAAAFLAVAFMADRYGTVQAGAEKRKRS